MATEKRLIDRNEIFPNGTFFVSAENPMKSLDELIERIWSIHTVDAVEVVHGCNVYDHDTSFECSVCGWGDYDTLTADTAKYNYCPNCGAKMDGESTSPEGNAHKN